jgi:hypothetical protein
MHTEYNLHDWAALCAATDALFAECGSRPRAFKEACRRNPHLNATPPTTSQAPATPGATQGRPEDSPIVKACAAAAARAVTARSTEPPGDRLGAVGNALDPSQSAVVRACEARAASSSQGR